MVCIRCKMAVETVLQENGIAYTALELGRVKLREELTADQKCKLEAGLKRFELELIEDKTGILMGRIKNEVNRLLQPGEAVPFKLSVHLSELLQYNYTYLANTFSEAEGITLERYFITQRVERVKELLMYEESPLSAIAEQLGFSSVSHLCQQFKKVTGFTPAEFKKSCQSEDFIWRRV